MNSATTAGHSPLCSFCSQVRIYMLQSRLKKKKKMKMLHSTKDRKTGDNCTSTSSKETFFCPTRWPLWTDKTVVILLILKVH